MAKNMFKFAMQLFAVDAASAKITAVQKKLSELNEASERIQQRGVDMMKNGSVKMLESVAMIAPLGKTILDASRVEDVMNELSNVAGMSAAKMADVSDAFFNIQKSIMRTRLNISKPQPLWLKAVCRARTVSPRQTLP